VSQKLARIVSFKPWGWALVSGLYVDDINAAFYASLWRVAGMMAVVCLLLAAIVLAVNAACTYHRRQPEYAAEMALKIAGKDLSVAIRTDATTISLLFAMRTMQENLPA
jgi:methyl-accepting chemotaxis protein